MSGVSWTGPGLTAFALAAPAGPRSAAVPSPLKECAPSRLGREHPPEGTGEGTAVPRRVEGWSAFERAFLDVAPLERAEVISRFWSRGGRPCLVLADPRFADPDWAGEDGGPGYRTGLHALAEADEAGTIVVAGPSSPRRQEQALALAARRPEVFVLLEGAPRAGEAVSYLAPNAAVTSGGDEGIGALAAWLEAIDFEPGARGALGPRRPPRGVGARDLAPVLAWRRREGLRRSVDLGTRWMVFEPSHPITWGRAEREVSAFLGRLERWGFFGRAGVAPFRVACGPAPPRAAGSSGAAGAAGAAGTAGVAGAAAGPAAAFVRLRVELWEPPEAAAPPGEARATGTTGFRKGVI